MAEPKDDSLPVDDQHEPIQLDEEERRQLLRDLRAAATAGSQSCRRAYLAVNGRAMYADGDDPAAHDPEGHEPDMRQP